MTDFTKLKTLSPLDRAIRLATQAHQGQVDKAGAPYIDHPIRVAARCDTEAQKIVALLHDVLEDTAITKQDLYDLGFSTEIVTAIQSVTKIEGEDYLDFIRRAKTNPIGRLVKLRDLEDNLDVTRLPEIQQNDLERINRYLSARRLLLE